MASYGLLSRLLGVRRRLPLALRTSLLLDGLLPFLDLLEAGPNLGVQCNANVRLRIFI